MSAHSTQARKSPHTRPPDLDQLLSTHASELQTRVAADGERLELPDDRVWILRRGEVLVYAGPRPVELWAGPRALGVGDSHSDCPRPEFVAVGSVELAGLARSSLGAEARVVLLEAENQALWRRVSRDVERDDDMFMAEPGAIPVPGPWWFRRAQVHALVVQGDPEQMAAAMPRYVRPLPGLGGRYVLAIVQFEGAGAEDPEGDPRRFAYREITPFWPAWSRGVGPCAFIPELYPDAWMAMVLGREILGFPKRSARVGLHDHGAELIVERRLAMRTRWTDARALDPAEALADLTRTLVPSEQLARLTRFAVDRFPEHLGLSAVVRRRIGAPETAGRSASLDELVRVPVRLDPIRRAEVLGQVELSCAEGRGILHGRVLGGWRLESGIHFGHGRRLRSLGKRGGPRP